MFRHGYKLEFAQRSRDAMHLAGLEPRPGVLVNLFNTREQPWGEGEGYLERATLFAFRQLPVARRKIIVRSPRPLPKRIR